MGAALQHWIICAGSEILQNSGDAHHRESKRDKPAQTQSLYKVTVYNVPQNNINQCNDAQPGRRNTLLYTSVRATPATSARNNAVVVKVFDWRRWPKSICVHCQAAPPVSDIWVRGKIGRAGGHVQPTLTHCRQRVRAEIQQQIYSLLSKAFKLVLSFLWESSAGWGSELHHM